MTTDVNKTLMHYPAHATEFFVVCSPEALKLMTHLACYHGHDEKALKQDGSYKTLLKEHVRVLKQLKKDLVEADAHDVLQELQKKLMVKLDPRICIGESLAKDLEFEEEDVISVGDDQLVYGIEFADRELAGWEVCAIAGFLETELGYTVNHIGYGSIEHQPWANFVQD